MEYVLIDCKPVPKKLGPEVQALKDATGATLTSCERTQQAVNYARSKGCKLSSQAELYNGYINGWAGYNPANPPGYSTHERRSDGVAYAVPRGMPLFYWQVGMDWGSYYWATKICNAAREKGWVATITYPSQSNELHHVNFRKEPILQIFRPLKVGSSGLRVTRLTKRLAFISIPSDREHTYLADSHSEFDSLVEKAVKQFQGDHGLKADGVVGLHTSKQIDVSYRAEKRRRQLNRALADLAKVEANLENARSRKRDQEKAYELAKEEEDGPRQKALLKEIDETNGAIRDFQKKAVQLRDEIVKLGGDPSNA